MSSPPSPTANSHRMQPQELRASLSLASIFALRMLGLFLVLPVFSLEAQKYPGGHDAAMVGLAMGIYGLTQALLQLPLGMASDRLGRKPVIVAGLVVFALGSALAAWATTLEALTIGRAIQGAGAVSAAVTALLTDQTRDEVRTKAMALVGGSIALMFAISLVAAPALAAVVGLAGLFGITCALALMGIAVVIWWVPTEPPHRPKPPSAQLFTLLAEPSLKRLFFGVFVLHAVQLAMWVVVPALLVQAGLAKAQQWQVYLPAVVVSFVAMGGLFALERRGHQKKVLMGAIALLALVQIGFWALVDQPQLGWLAACLLVFFMAFNILEASQPSLTSKLAPAHSRGAAMGIFNTLQSLGFFTGGALGGWVASHWGAHALFLMCTGAVALWWLASWGLKLPTPLSQAPNPSK